MSVDVIAEALLPSGSEILWTPTESGYMNQSWVGSLNGEKLYIIREYLRTDSSEEILSEHRLLDHLYEELGDLVAPTIADDNGNTLHHFETKKYALFPYRHGEPMVKYRSDQCRPAARTLAQLHCLLVTHRLEFDDIRHTRPSLSADYFSDIARLKQFMAEAPEAENLRTQYLDDQFIQNCFEQVTQTLTAPDLLDAVRCPIHGDYASLNLLWNAEQKEVTTVLDWEECRWDSPLFDLASASQFFCWNKRSDDLTGDFIPEYMNELKVLNPELYEHMESLVPLTPKIRQTIWLFECLIMMNDDQVDIEELQELCGWMKL